MKKNKKVSTIEPINDEANGATNHFSFLKWSKIFKERRKYVVVIIFAAAALLTPPDPITQIGLAIPLLLLYELSILSVNIIDTKNLRRKKEEENAWYKIYKR